MRLHIAMKRVEWTLLLFIAVIAAMLAVPSLLPTKPSYELKQAQSLGIFHPADSKASQIFYGKKVRVLGAAVQGNKMQIFFEFGYLPFSRTSMGLHPFKVTTDMGQELVFHSGGGSSSNGRITQVHADFEDLPQGTSYITVDYESYGQSFHYRINLAAQGGNDL